MHLVVKYAPGIDRKWVSFTFYGSPMALTCHSVQVFLPVWWGRVSHKSTLEKYFTEAIMPANCTEHMREEGLFKNSLPKYLSGSVTTFEGMR